MRKQPSNPFTRIELLVAIRHPLGRDRLGHLVGPREDPLANRRHCITSP
jgi:hypothetical protein